MEIDLLWLIASFGGGAFGAAIGGQTAFIFTGLLFLVGLGSYMGGADAGGFMGSVVFGPVFGPHIAFLGGAAAAAYGAKRGVMAGGANGRDIVTPLAGIGRSDVLAVGGVFGMLGYLLNQAFAALPTFSVSNPDLQFGNEAIGWTDTVAFTIIVLSIVIRFMFGSTGLFSTRDHPLLAVGEGKHWVEHQEGWGITAMHGFTSGLMSAFATLVVIIGFFDVSGGTIQNHAFLIGWAISAVTLVFLSAGMKTPVTHHMTILASLAATKFVPVLAGTSVPSEWDTTSLAIAALIGAVFGIIGGLLGEALSRMTNANGDTHIDPPAFAIWVGTTIIFAITAVVA
ncbi:hypothetical protein EJO69_06625 [Flaviflexus salsibiostraticola]|uniref:DUF7973 domain-containing protein n=1 Tax=Flaviflexus salsibiostraticola TaxID=1282737 RepID=A0A3Q8WU71_9ACTO|nr:hypothetical protein [Flaviflexus salsibiostraticola]AZN30019.1 hypothetical protein EJO69_06625 [Flaviflexus salsibiostraticola]